MVAREQSAIAHDAEADKQSAAAQEMRQQALKALDAVADREREVSGREVLLTEHETQRSMVEGELRHAETAAGALEAASLKIAYRMDKSDVEAMAAREEAMAAREKRVADREASALETERLISDKERQLERALERASEDESRGEAVLELKHAEASRRERELGSLEAAMKQAEASLREREESEERRAALVASQEEALRAQRL